MICNVVFMSMSINQLKKHYLIEHIVNRKEETTKRIIISTDKFSFIFLIEKLLKKYEAYISKTRKVH